MLLCKLHPKCPQFFEYHGLLVGKLLCRCRGFVYDMLGIPVELYTPIFAVARIVGWSAHRLEEIVGNGKIIRPSYKSVMEEL